MTDKHFGDNFRGQTWILRVRTTDRAKLATIGLLAFRNAKTGRCDPSEKRLAEVLGKCERTVRRGLKEAVEARLVSVTRRHNRSSSYVIHDDERHRECYQGLRAYCCDTHRAVPAASPRRNDPDTAPDTSGFRAGHTTSEDWSHQVTTPDSVCPPNSLEQSRTDHRSGGNTVVTTSEPDLAIRLRRKYPEGMDIVKRANPRGYMDLGRVARWAQERFTETSSSADLVAAIDACGEPIVPAALDEILRAIESGVPVLR